MDEYEIFALLKMYIGLGFIYDGLGSFLESELIGFGNSNTA